MSFATNVVIKGSFFTVSFSEIAVFIASKSLFISSNLEVISFFFAVNSVKLPEEMMLSTDVSLFLPQETKIADITNNEYIFSL